MLNNEDYFEYDFNGNVTGDAARGMAIGYNLLNLPSWFNDGESDLMVFYDYLADGTKVALHREDTGMGRAWLGDLVFNLQEDARDPEDPGDGSRGNSASTLSKRDTTGTYLKVAKNANLRGPEEEEDSASYSFESTPYAGGRIESIGNDVKVRKFVTDHLGSVRAIVTDNAVVERNDYYPFGGRHDNTILPTLTTNRYGFIGKERQNISSSLDPYIDFGARFYDPLTARWLSPDPLADKYTSLTQYNYCGGDPVNYVDPDGKDIWEVIDGRFVFKGSSDDDIVKISTNNTESEDNKFIIFPKGTIIKDYFLHYHDGSVNYPISTLKVKGDIEAEELFEFLATNVNSVEWEQVSIGDRNTNYVGTSNMSDKTSLLPYLFSNNYNIRSAVHSHPSGISEFSENDKTLFNAILKSNHSVKFYIWTITHSYRQYFPSK